MLLASLREFEGSDIFPHIKAIYPQLREITGFGTNPSRKDYRARWKKANSREIAWILQNGEKKEKEKKERFRPIYGYYTSYHEIIRIARTRDIKACCCCFCCLLQLGLSQEDKSGKRNADRTRNISQCCVFLLN